MSTLFAAIVRRKSLALMACLLAILGSLAVPMVSAGLTPSQLSALPGVAQAPEFVRALASSPLVQGRWRPTGDLGSARQFHTATMLYTDKVLVAGGQGSASVLASAELYDWRTGNWSATGSLSVTRYSHTATELLNGKVLVVGGYNGAAYLASAEVYDPATGTWAATGSLGAARANHTATLLPTGEVLVSGGQGDAGFLASAELYDPATGTWSAAGTLAVPRVYHAATLLPSGKVLVSGGYDGSGPPYLSSAELFDRGTRLWSYTDNTMSIGRKNHTATALADGKVLVSGGDGGLGVSASVQPSAELYDPQTGLWSPTSNMGTARAYHSEAKLADGKVLVIGGFDGFSYLASTELYDPASGTWVQAGGLATPRQLNSATLLPNGRVLISGTYSATGAQRSSDVYSEWVVLLPSVPK